MILSGLLLILFISEHVLKAAEKSEVKLASISQSDYDKYLNDLDMAKVEKKIKATKKISDLTVIMPQSGVKYSLEPTSEQEKIYR